MTWYNDSYRHSLASHGIHTTVKHNFMPVEVKRTFRGASRREALYDTIDWLKKSLEHPPDDLSPEEFDKWHASREQELSEKQSEFDRLYSPKRTIKASEAFSRAAWQERYKGTKGRKPEVVGDLALQLSLMKTPQEKAKDYRENLKEGKLERAELSAIRRIENEILAGKIEDPLTAEVVSRVKVGRAGDPDPVLLEEEELEAILRNVEA